MNIYELKFIGKDNKIHTLNQYGETAASVKKFWTKWLPEHYDEDPVSGKFLSCKLIEEDVVW